MRNLNIFRNIAAQTTQKSAIFKDRRAPKQGARNEHQEYLEEYYDELLDELNSHLDK